MVVITGASAGLGRLFAQAFARAGWSVHGTSRDPQRLAGIPGLQAWPLDLADAGSRQRFLQSILEKGIPDLYIGNAGSGVFGGYDQLSGLEEQHLWEVLLHGPLELIKGLLTPMRQAGKGTIFSISSLAAELPIPYCAVYNGAKAALSQVVQSLMLEQSGRPWLKDIRLGDFCTEFNESIKQLQPSEGDRERWQTVWEKMEQHVKTAPLPEVLESRIVKLADRPGHQTIRWGNFFQACLASKGAPLLPSRWLRHWIGKYYGISI